MELSRGQRNGENQTALKRRTIREIKKPSKQAERTRQRARALAVRWGESREWICAGRGGDKVRTGEWEVPE